MLKKIIASFFTLCLLLFLPAAGLTAKVAGVTDTEIVIGISAPLSGPAALWGTVSMGATAWANHINDQGGIHGRKIRVLIRDDAYSPARAVSNLLEMRGRVLAVVGLLGTAVLHATRDFFAENRIVSVTPFGNVRIFEDYPIDKLRWIFVSWTDYVNEAEFLTTFAVNNLGSKKISVFYQNDDYGESGLAGVKQALGKFPAGRATLGAAIPYELPERALATHAIKLKASGADTLILYTTMTHAALILREITRIGYRPRVLTTFTLADPIMFRIAGPDIWEGVYSAAPANAGIPGEPEADRIVKIITKYDPRIVGMEFMGLFGAISMMHLVEGLRNAGRDLTPEGLIRGMEMIRKWRPEGMGAPVTYAPDRRHGVSGSRMTRAEKGRLVPITDFVIFKPLF